MLTVQYVRSGTAYCAYWQGGNVHRLRESDCFTVCAYCISWWICTRLGGSVYIVFWCVCSFVLILLRLVSLLLLEFEILLWNAIHPNTVCATDINDTSYVFLKEGVLLHFQAIWLVTLMKADSWNVCLFYDPNKRFKECRPIFVMFEEILVLAPNLAGRA